MCEPIILNDFEKISLFASEHREKINQLKPEDIFGPKIYVEQKSPISNKPLHKLRGNDIFNDKKDSCSIF